MSTIKDVAEKAGVAYSTASIALRGVGSVKGATRERVLRVAAELGYQANPAAAALAGQRKRGARPQRRFGMAVVVAEGGEKDMALPGILAEGKALGYEVSLLPIAKLKPWRAGWRGLWHRGVEGLVLLPNWEWEQLDWRIPELSRFAMVKLGRVLPELPVPLVRPSIVAMVEEGLDRIFAMGHQRVLCWAIRTPSRLDDDIRLGSFYAYRENHLPKGCELDWRVLPGRSDETRSRAALESLRKIRPDAVLSFPWSAWYWLREAGIRMPEDLFFAGCPLRNQGEPGAEDVPGMDPLRMEQGRLAVRRMHEQILAGQRGIPEAYTETVVEPVWRGPELRRRGP
jgi:LacI family transcriptional regulator